MTEKISNQLTQSDSLTQNQESNNEDNFTAFDPNLVELALEKLIEVLDKETVEIEKYSIKDKPLNLSEFIEKKSDIINFLEWQSRLIVSYLADGKAIENEKQKINANNRISVNVGKEDDNSIIIKPIDDISQQKQRIKELLRKLHASAEKNFDQIKRKKFITDKIIESITLSVNEEKEQFRGYNNKAIKANNASGKSVPHVVLNENV